MPSISLPKLHPRRSLRRLQTAFGPADSSDSTTSPQSATRSASAASAIDFRGLDKRLNASVTNLILTSLDENGSWASSSGPSALSPSSSDLSTSPGSPSQEPWKPDTWTGAPLPAPEPESRGMQRIIRKKQSKIEIRQSEERQQVRGDLLGMIEPRPGTGVASGGIEEVLHGEA